MNDKMKLIKALLFWGIAFQFFLVTALIVFDGWILYHTGEPHEGITGALMGLMTGVGLTSTVSFLLNVPDSEEK